eukprot:scaffold773_cov140-Skeletonema_marinoi.AAC.17
MGTWSLDEERESFQCKIGRWRPLNIRVFTVDARAQFRARGVKTTSDKMENGDQNGRTSLSSP